MQILIIGDPGEDRAIPTALERQFKHDSHTSTIVYNEKEIVREIARLQRESMTGFDVVIACHGHLADQLRIVRQCDARAPLVLYSGRTSDFLPNCPRNTVPLGKPAAIFEFYEAIGTAINAM